MHPIIEFKHVYKNYDNKEILNDFNLSIERGSFVTIIGTSGGGKTTILKMVNGLLTPDTGSIFINGKDICSMNLVQLRRNIGYAIQGNVLFPHMTVAENIAYVPSLLNKHDRTHAQAAVKKWLKIVGLEQELLDRYPSELSGGQQQRVGIARALAASPEILLMDEPFGAVDEITRTSLQQEISHIHQETGITVLFVTHDIREALLLGTKVLVIANGTIQQYASSDTILHNPANEFVRQLVHAERHTCHLPDKQLLDCEYSGAAKNITRKESLMP